MSSRRYDLGHGAWVEQGRLPQDLPACGGGVGAWQLDFERLWGLRPAERGQVVMHGHAVATPRWQQAYMRPYFFSGMVHEALPLPQAFEPFLEWARSLPLYGDLAVNAALINFYANGQDYIGRHSDDERELVPGAPIVSISLGQKRTFRVRNRLSGAVALDLDMPHATYVAMGGAMQRHFLHEVPKVAGAKGAAMGRRINVTFRVQRGD